VRGRLVGRGSRMSDAQNQSQEMICVSCAALGLKIRRAAGQGCGITQSENTPQNRGSETRKR
jgi:hypothetical protein